MPRATNAPARKKKKKKLFDRVKGFRGGRGKLYRTAKETAMRAMVFSYQHRKLRKRDFRRLWIARITAASKANGISYSAFIHGLAVSGIRLDRQILADLAVREPGIFADLVGRAKSSPPNN